MMDFLIAMEDVFLSALKAVHPIFAKQQTPCTPFYCEEYADLAT